MDQPDLAFGNIARGRRGLAVRGAIRAVGGTDHHIRQRLSSGRWTRLHSGVYLVGVAPPDWLGRLDAAVLAAGEGAAASHRAALVLWGLDGIGAAPLEVTVPVTHGPVPSGVIVHRSRRPVTTAVVEGIAVTGIERTLVDAASCLPPVVVEKAMESAVRRNLTTATKIERYLEDHAGRGVRGARALREIMAERPPGRAAGSGAEVELLRLLRAHGLPAPVRQYEVALPGGAVAVVDLAWPELRRVVEVDGLDAHAGAEALDQDDDRQNRLLEAGYELRRYTGRSVRRRPEAVVASIRRFLGS